LPSVGSWLLLVVGISLVGYVFHAKVLFQEGYKLAFATGTIVFVLHSIQNFLYYLILKFYLRQLQSIYITIAAISLGAGIL
jgi:hypothetical protein